MRNNQPVKDQEYSLQEEMLLVSKTDLQGTITYVNEDFIAASGYNHDELMGQPHNLLRHPDVPAAVFEDMWQTIQAGRPWRQIVKNRRKNGDHYWVVANTSAIYENGKITGYLSVRRPAKASEKSATEQAYQAIAAKKMRLTHGQVNTFWRRFNPFAHWNPLVTIIPATLVAVLAGFSVFIWEEIPSWLNAITVFLTVLSTLHILYYLNRINDAIGAIRQIRDGHFFKFIDIHGENSSGLINRQIQNLQTQLGAQMDEINRNLKDGQRLSAGLNNQQSMMMLADQNGTITYMNQALIEFLAPKQSSIRQEVPDFEVTKLLNKSTGCLFKNDLQLLQDILKTQTVKQYEFEFFGAQIGLIVSPIMVDNKRLGLVFEWQDIFQQQFVEESFKNIVKDAGTGRLHSRMPTERLDGFYLEMADGINQLMENLQSTMQDISILVNGLAEKDLTAQPEAKHDGQFEWTIQNLVHGFDALRLSFCGAANLAEEVHQSAASVHASNQELSDSIRSQVQELQRTTDAMKTITEKVEGTSTQAQQANTLALETQHKIQAGNENMNQAVAAMNEIEQVSSEITGIVGLIDSIAFQTNLLALNAAVEAARAGEHGRGFAVVAGEVRNLAQRSAGAAREIKTLIEQTAEKVQAGTEKVVTTSESMNEIIQQVGEMTDRISTISNNAHHQSKEITHISHSIQEIDEAAEMNATLVMENSSLSHYLQDVANTMGDLVSSFDLGECESHSQHNTQKNQPLILIADDNLSNQKVAEMLLKKFGYRTVNASNGQDAVNKTERFKPDAILMDIEMPKMDGNQATQQIRSRGKRMPIFAYTGHTDSHIEGCLDTGMQGVLHKPLQPDELKQRLQDAGIPGVLHEKQQLEIKRKKSLQKSELARRFDEMIKAHLAWKKRIRQFISGAQIGVTYENAIDHTACVLGKWYYSEGQSMMSCNVMQQLGEDHKQMHGTIKIIMDAFAVDDYVTIR